MRIKLKLIIVDIDGTLMPGSMERIFFRYLRDKGRVSWLRVFWNVLVILLTSGWPRWHKLKVAYLRGLRVDDVRRLAKECYESETAPTLYLAMRDGLRKLQRKGLEVVLLSGTLDLLAELLAKDWGYDQFIAAEPVARNGRYAGGLREPHPYGKRKVEFARRMIERRGLDWLDVGTIADHHQDRFLLKKAARAVVVNPRGDLSRLADKNGWGRLYQMTNLQHIEDVLEANFES